MIDTGLYPEYLLFVDHSLKAQHCDIIICAINGEFTVKELYLEPTPKLVAYNDDFEDIPLGDDIDFEVFGVVKNIIREVKRGHGHRFDS